MKKKVFALIMVVALLVGGCGTPLTIQPTDIIYPHSKYLTPMATPGTPFPMDYIHQMLPDKNVHPIYIAIDESASITNKDNSGEPCDPEKWRYKIPLSMVDILSDWKDKGVNNARDKTYLYWMQQTSTYLEQNDITLSLRDRLQSTSSIIQNEGYPQFLNILSEYQKQLLNAPYSNLFIFTDGDFRSIRPGTPNGNQISDKVYELLDNIKKTYPGSNINFVLLCSRRLDESYIKTNWNNIETQGLAKVYGLYQDDITVNTKEVLIEVFSSFMTSMNWSESPNNTFDRQTAGWGIIDGKHTAELPPDIIYLRQGTSKLNGENDNSSVVLDDSGTIPLALQAINPLEGCQQSHKLYFSSIDGLYFYWWLADLPVIRVSFEGERHFAYNNLEETIEGEIDIVSILYPDKPVTQKYQWFPCILFKLRNGFYDVQVNQEGEFRIPIVNTKIDNALPNSAQTLAIESRWKSSPQFFLDVYGDSDTIEPRYYPKFAELVEVTRNDSDEQQVNVEYKIFLNFFDSRYYPDWPQEEWQPQIKFVTDKDTTCHSGLSTWLSPISQQMQNDPFILKYWFNYGANPDQASLTIELFGSSDSDIQDCTYMLVQWNKWPQNKIIEGWITPPSLRCALNWSQKAPYILSELSCEENKQ